MLASGQVDVPDERYAVALLAEMIDTPSPSGAEQRLAEILARRMETLGLSVRRDAAGNVLGAAGLCDGPTVLLVSHLDTAGGHLPLRRAAGRLHGRGAVDAKGALAAMICAAARCQDLPGRVVVAGVVEEERPSSAGAVELARHLPQPAAVIVGEPSGSSSVVIGYKGQLLLDYEVHCPPSHPTSACPTAAELATAFWEQLCSRARVGSAAGFNTLSMTLVEMHGDLTRAALRIDCRTPPGFNEGAFLASLDDIVGSARTSVAASIPAVLADRCSPVVRVLRAAIRQHGGTPRHKVRAATSDMNVFARQWTAPMATYGPGDSRLDHSDNECIEIDEYLRAIDILTMSVQTLASEMAEGGTGGRT